MSFDRRVSRKGIAARRAWSRNAHAARARKRLAGPDLAEWDEEPCRVPPGELLGTLVWIDPQGQERRWTVLQGKRANQIRVAGMEKSHGWDWLCSRLRKKLAVPKRIFPA